MRPNSSACSSAVSSLSSITPAVGVGNTAVDAFTSLLDSMKIDKKARGNQLRFVLLDGLAVPGRLEGPAEELLASAYAATCADRS